MSDEARARIDALWVYGRPLDVDMQGSPRFQVYEFMANDLGDDDPPRRLTDAFFAALDAAGLVVVDRERFERLQRMALKAKEMGRTTVGLQDSDFEPLPGREGGSE